MNKLAKLREHFLTLFTRGGGVKGRLNNVKIDCTFGRGKLPQEDRKPGKIQVKKFGPR